jgi:hypothetical protein
MEISHCQSVKGSDTIKTNRTMNALVLVKCLCLRYVLERFPRLVPTFPLHKEFQASALRLSVVTNLFYLPFFLASIVHH